MNRRRVLSLVISACVVITAAMTGCQQGGGNSGSQAQSGAGTAPETIAAQSSRAYSNAGMDDLNSGLTEGSGGGSQTQTSSSQRQSQAQQSQTPPNWLSNQSQAQSSASSSRRQVIYNQTPEIGKTVKFGAYEQDNDLSNGPEPIEWIITGKYEGNYYGLLSVYGLDQVDYDTKDKVTAKDSYIYKWMNDDFYNEAFNDEEKAFMGNYEYGVSTNHNSEFTTLIKTKVGLFSPTNIKGALKDDNARKAKATAYAKARGAQIQDGQCWYWLCPTADLENVKLYDTHAACVNYDGSIIEKIDINKSTGGAVRPFILVNLEAMIKQ